MERARSTLNEPQEAVSYVRSAQAIRERCAQVSSLAKSDGLSWFSFIPERLDAVVDAVQKETLASYPDLNVPYHSRWRHFSVGGVDREARVNYALRGLSVTERSRAKLELAIVSVLLDAGAGSAWRYTESGSSVPYGRSEGLAVASLDAFAVGLFGDEPYTVTSQGLARLSPQRLSNAFQVSDANPLIGVDGRCSLLNRLGKVIEEKQSNFSGSLGRLGGILEPVAALAHGDSGVRAGDLLHFVLETFSDIWPGRIALGGCNLGDVWRHSKVRGPGLTDNLIPFHKLSQWLTYSLLEPLQEAGVAVVALDELTGLAEYRNGGLFLDGGVLALKDPALREQSHQPSSELIVEWRALTVALLDEVALSLRKRLGRSELELPLASVLQGGTWSVGRLMAAVRDPLASPPLMIESDGTVF
jgi:hypothetical protein